MRVSSKDTSTHYVCVVTDDMLALLAAVDRRNALLGDFGKPANFADHPCNRNSPRHSEIIIQLGLRPRDVDQACPDIHRRIAHAQKFEDFSIGDFCAFSQDRAIVIEPTLKIVQVGSDRRSGIGSGLAAEVVEMGLALVEFKIAVRIAGGLQHRIAHKGAAKAIF